MFLLIGIQSAMTVCMQTRNGRPGVEAKQKQSKFLEQAVSGYLECMMWSHGDEFDSCSYATSAVEELTEQVLHFASCAIEVFARHGVKLQERVSGAQFGHSFALSRNGHGAGFFDLDLGETDSGGDVADILQAAAERRGCVDLVLGNDGLVYCS